MKRLQNKHKQENESMGTMELQMNHKNYSHTGGGIRKLYIHSKTHTKDRERYTKTKCK